MARGRPTERLDPGGRRIVWPPRRPADRSAGSYPRGHQHAGASPCAGPARATTDRGGVPLPSTDEGSPPAVEPPRVPRRIVSPLLRGDGETGDHSALLNTVDGRVAVLVELNVSHGLSTAGPAFEDLYAQLFPGPDRPRPVRVASRYVQCWLTTGEIARLADADRDGPGSIFRVWPDFRVVPHIDRSAATVKADAAARSYGT